jgi:hypothetical protein
MTIYNLWIFDEKGTLLFYREWIRKNHTSMEKEEVPVKFIFCYVRLHVEIAVLDPLSTFFFSYEQLS